MDWRYILTFALMAAVIAYHIYSAPFSDPICESLDETRNQCYLDLALEMEDAGVCEAIHEETERMLCFKGVAIDSGDRRVCDRIPDSSIRDSCLLELGRLEAA